MGLLPLVSIVARPVKHARLVTALLKATALMRSKAQVPIFLGGTDSHAAPCSFPDGQTFPMPLAWAWGDPAVEGVFWRAVMQALAWQFTLSLRRHSWHYLSACTYQEGLSIFVYRVGVCAACAPAQHGQRAGSRCCH